MKITQKTVLHLAKLANIQLSPDEAKMYAKQFAAIVKYMDLLQEINIENVSPLTYPDYIKGKVFEDGTPNRRGYKSLKHLKVNSNNYFVTQK